MRRADRRAAALVAALAAAAFLPALRNGFVNYDDSGFLENPHLLGLGWANLKWMFTTTYLGPYQPLSWLSLALDRLLWGWNPIGIHLTSLLLHAAAAAAFYFLSRTLLELALPGQKKGQALAAAFAALFFALHPLRVESVAWATERRDALSGIFYILALSAYLASRTAPSAERRRRWGWASLAAYALSLLSKGIGVSLPATLLVLDFYPLGRFKGERPAPALKRLLREKLPYIALSLAAGAVGVLGQAHAQTLVSLESHGALARLAIALYAPAFYAAKTLLPFGLSPLYELPVRVDPFAPRYVLGASATLAAALLLWRARRRRPEALAAGAHCLAALLPVLGLLRFGAQAAADRYTYLPCLGFSLLAGAWCGVGLDSRRVLLGSAALAALFGLTWRQIGCWRDSETLWRHALEIDPDSAIARHNLAGTLFEQGRLEEALAEDREALRLKPGFPDARENLAQTLAGLGRLEEAAEEYRVLGLLQPREGGPRLNRGSILLSLGRLPEAAAEFEAVLALDPDSPGAHYDLALAREAQGRVPEALAEYRAAVGLKPEYWDAWNNLGVLLAKAGRLAEAEAALRRVAVGSPEYAAARNNLGLTLNRLGRPAEAAAVLQEALSLKPDYADAHYNLALSLLALRRPSEAREHLQEVLWIDPGNAAARRALQRLAPWLGRAP